MTNETGVLAVYPHPDDETFGKAGTIAQFTRAGIPVTLVCGTLGQMGRNMGKPSFATRESLPAIRERELRDACDILGVDDLRLLRLRDKTLEFEDPQELADRLELVLKELHPSLVMTYYPGYGVHPDHDALGRATVLAVSRLAPAQRPVVYASAVTRDVRDVLGPPDVDVDVSDVLDVKLAAMRAHRSQSQANMQRMEAQAQADADAKQRLEQTLRREIYWIYKF